MNTRITSNLSGSMHLRVSGYIASLFNISFFKKESFNKKNGNLKDALQEKAVEAESDEEKSPKNGDKLKTQSKIDDHLTENIKSEEALQKKPEQSDFDENFLNKHVPIMESEILEALKMRKDKCYIDCTFGAGGHTQAMLEHGAIVYALDRDEQAFTYANKLNKYDRFFYKHTSFANIESVWSDNIAPLKVDGVLFDLGFSSNQIENAHRGFSFSKDGQLDMRFDLNQELDGKRWINTASEEELCNVFFHYGQERNAKAIAKAIVKHRKKSHISTTFDLVKIIEEYNKFDHKHAATRIFQAIRIHVNDEFTHIQRALHGAKKILRQHGRLAVLTFHSLEDKIVKNFFENEVHFIMCPTAQEIKKNPRARSAKLRWMIKTEEA